MKHCHVTNYSRITALKTKEVDMLYDRFLIFTFHIAFAFGTELYTSRHYTVLTVT